MSQGRVFETEDGEAVTVFEGESASVSRHKDGIQDDGEDD